jgi:secreted trypsin-like serine protease
MAVRASRAGVAVSGKSKRHTWTAVLAAVACLSLSAVASGEASGEQADRSGLAQKSIAGGYVPSTAEWPWVARVTMNTSHCTGTLITQDRVLTAAHCVVHDGVVTPASAVTVEINRRNPTLPGEVRHVTLVVAHPGYDVPGYDDDVAVLFLDSPVALPPAPLGSPGDLPESGVVMGWGRIDYEGDPIARTTELKAVNLSLGSPSQCDAWQKNFRPATQICAYDAAGENCVGHGDSGGPLMVNLGGWKLIGVVSHHQKAGGWGPCGGHAREIFAWIGGPTLRNWLLSVANPGCPAAIVKLKKARKLPKSNRKRKKSLRNARAQVAKVCTLPG